MADHKLNVSGGKPELGTPSLSINPPAEKPVEEQKPQQKEDGNEEAAGPAGDKD